MKSECETKLSELVEIEELKDGKRRFNLEFKSHEDLFNNIQIGTIKKVDAPEAEKRCSSSSSSPCSSPKAKQKIKENKIPMTPPNTPKKPEIRKTNFEIVKERGLWKGEENLEFWCPSGVAMDSKSGRIII
jgi:hypothetical protein